jgi:hypothetical protein
MSEYAFMWYCIIARAPWGPGPFYHDTTELFSLTEGMQESGKETRDAKI